MYHRRVRSVASFRVLTIASVMKMGARYNNSIWSLCVALIKVTCIRDCRDETNIKQVSINFRLTCKGVEIILRYKNIMVNLPLGFLIIVFRGLFGIMFSETNPLPELLFVGIQF